VYRVRVVPGELDAVGGVPYLRAESEDTYLLVRLAGVNDGQGGLYRCALLLPDRPPLLQCISLHGTFWGCSRHAKQDWSTLSAEEAEAVLGVLEDPPLGSLRYRPPYVSRKLLPRPRAAPGCSVA
jgi:hypothetical protein